MELRYNSLAGLVRAATESGRQISELVLADQAKQMERDPKLLFQEMDRRLTVMDEAADEGVQPDLRSTSGLTGGSAYLLTAVIRSVAAFLRARWRARSPFQS